MKSKSVFGMRIKARRKALKMNQEELAHETTSARQTVSSWESGVFLPSQENLMAIAKALNTTVAYLIGERDDPEPGEKVEPIPAIQEEAKVRVIKQARPAKLEDFARTRDASRNLDLLDDRDLSAISEMLLATLEAVEKERALRTAKDDGDAKLA